MFSIGFRSGGGGTGCFKRMTLLSWMKSFVRCKQQHCTVENASYNHTDEDRKSWGMLQYFIIADWRTSENIVLKASRTITHFFVSSENKTFFHLWTSHVWCSLARYKQAILWRWRKTWPLKPPDGYWTAVSTTNGLTFSFLVPCLDRHQSNTAVMFHQWL